jgi:hypothetical protein
MRAITLIDADHVRGPRHTIHLDIPRYAAYITKVFALLGVRREDLDWRSYAAWRPY